MVHLMPHKDSHYNSIPKVDVLLVLLYCLIYILNKVLIFSLLKNKTKQQKQTSLVCSMYLAGQNNHFDRCIIFIWILADCI